MKSILHRRPSPALVIACIALFVSLGGVSYGVATGFINSREIKNNSIRSKDVRNNTLRTFDVRNNEIRGFDIRNSSVQGRDVALNTLTGADISEQDLAQVPSAATADSATSAATAGSVGGVTMAKVAYSAAQGSGFVEVLNFGGLRLEASCGVGGTLVVRANPAEQNSEISGDFPGAIVNDADFDPGDDSVVSDSSGEGQIVFAAPNGAIVTVQALAREDLNDVRGTTDDCGFFGIAQAG